jgi:hypothetical protein
MDINLIGEIDGVNAIEIIHKQEKIPVIYTTGDSFYIINYFSRRNV